MEQRIQGDLPGQQQALCPLLLRLGLASVGQAPSGGLSHTASLGALALVSSPRRQATSSLPWGRHLVKTHPDSAGADGGGGGEAGRQGEGPRSSGCVSSLRWGTRNVSELVRVGNVGAPGFPRAPVWDFL